MKLTFECHECGHVWSNTFVKDIEIELDRKMIFVRSLKADNSAGYPIRCSICDKTRVTYTEEK